MQTPKIKAHTNNNPNAIKVRDGDIDKAPNLFAQTAPEIESAVERWLDA
jgi:hypothetical protein